MSIKESLVILLFVSLCLIVPSLFMFAANSTEYTSNYVTCEDNPQEYILSDDKDQAIKEIHQNNIQVYILSDDKDQALKEIHQDKVTTTEKDKQLEEEGDAM